MPGAATPRLQFLDGLRGVAIVLMAVNHTARWWTEVSLGWERYYLVYLSMTLPAAIFLFLAGFCLPLSFARVAASGRPPLGATLRKYAVRGGGIILGGLLLNVVVFPQDPVWTGGVLQTIGLAVVLLAPALWVLPSRLGRRALVALAVAFYVSFALLFDRLARIPADSFVAQAFFRDFPPWPWLSAALLGLVAGWVWLDARRRGPRREARYFWTAAALGTLAVIAYFLCDWLAQTSPRLSFRRDFLLNRHWTPRGATLLWVGGMTSLLLAASWLGMEAWKRRLPWLVVLGQTALMLYFLHQVIALTLVNEWLGWRFNDWPRYTAATVVLLVLLVYTGKLWLAVRRRWRPTAGPAAAAAGP
jgi:uncharacterized membrane protein